MSLFIVPNSYKSPSFNYIFQGVNHIVWAIVFTAIGLGMTVGTILGSFLWRICAAANGGVLFVWAMGFIFSGSFRRSPPSFFIWLSAAVLSVFVTIVIEPKVVEELLLELEKAKDHLTSEG